MARWRQLVFGLRGLLWRRQAHQDIDDEVRHFLELAAAEHEKRGLSQDEALRAARIEMGGTTSVIERLRSHGWEHAVGALVFDLRYSLRRLVREPVSSAALIGTVAIGIGTTTAIFGAVHGVLLRPLPYPEPERIVTIWDVGPGGGPLATTFGTFAELRARQRSFEGLATMKPWQPTLVDTDTPERLSGQRVSAGYFRVLGVRPAFGHDVGEDADRAGGPAEVILSHALWQRQLGGDPTILGRSIVLDEREHQVVGIMPADFNDPLAPAATVWTTLQYDLSQGRAWGHHLRMVGRLRPGVDRAAASRDLDRIATTPIEAYARPAWAALDGGFLVRSLKDEVTGDARVMLLSLFGAAALLLAIAGVNVSSLLLGRGARRRESLVLRLSLGAGRLRLMRQIAVEGAVSAALGGALGLFLAHLGERAIGELGSAHLPRVPAHVLEGSVVGFGLALIAGVVAATVWMAAVETGRICREGGSRGPAPRLAGGKTRGALVVVQVALAVVLLVCSGLLLRSLGRLLDIDVGFEATSVLTLQVDASGSRYDDERAVHRYFDQVLEAVRAVPGVVSTAATSQLPLSGDHDQYGVFLEGNVDEPDELPGAFRYAVTAGYFETMAIPLRAGRRLTSNDRAGAPLAALISESMAGRRFPGVDPVGQHARFGPRDRPPFTIVGVVGDVRQESLAYGGTDAFYVPAEQWHFADTVRSLVVRVQGADASVVAPAIRRAIWSVDDQRPIFRVSTLSDLVAASLAERRFVLLLFDAFAGASLLLALAGMYGLLGGWVAERERDLGVRAALGASRHDILTLVVGRGLALAGAGAVIGLSAAALVTRGLAALLFHVSPLDPITYGGVLTLLVGLAIVACAQPAWRAAGVDPVAVLRCQ